MATVTFYNSYLTKVLQGTNPIASATDTIKVALTSSSYVPSVDSHDFFNDITNEVVGTGYTAGGATIASPSVTQDNTNDRGVYDGDNVAWTSATFTARYAVIYKSTGVSSTSPLIGYIDFGSNQSPSGSTLQISWNNAGIILAEQG